MRSTYQIKRSCTRGFHQNKNDGFTFENEEMKTAVNIVYKYK